MSLFDDFVDLQGFEACHSVGLRLSGDLTMRELVVTMNGECWGNEQI